MTCSASCSRDRKVGRVVVFCFGAWLLALAGCGASPSDIPADRAGGDARRGIVDPPADLQPRPDPAATPKPGNASKDPAVADPFKAAGQAAASPAQASDKGEQPPADKQAPTQPKPQGPDEAQGNAGATKVQAMPTNPFPHRIKAPGLDGGVAWINTAGPLELEQLRGKFVLLDFWTYCCINCMHVLPELKKLEKAYPNELVVIGVHSAKFETERDSRNITEAVMRYGIEHPVVNDANHAIWNRYGISSWPTMLLIDPEGQGVYARSGESTFEQLDTVLKFALPYYRAKGVLDETPLHFDLEQFRAKPTPLRFPGKILADEAGDRLFIADSNHHRIVVTRLDGTLVEIIGAARMGTADGDYTKACFNQPQGMVLDGNVLYVADTENHLLRKVDLKARQVTTIAGVGQQGRNAWPGLEESLLGGIGANPLPQRWVGKPLETPINSPWALWVHEKSLYIAMAGPHQIWKMLLDGTEIGPYAGNGREDIVDGPLLPKEPYQEGYSSFAQPSGLASDGTSLFVADSEGSSIRAVPFDPAAKVSTVVGTAYLEQGRLFAFGDVDGQGEEVRLQHALGIVFHDGLLYVADTYNNKIKVIDPRQSTCKTLAGTGAVGSDDVPATFDEPAGISYAGGKLYVADTNNHLIRTIDLHDNNRVATLQIKGLASPAPTEPDGQAVLKGARQVAVPETTVRPAQGNVALNIDIELPDGYKINPLAPMRYSIEAKGSSGPVKREALGKSVRVAKPATSLAIELPVSADGGRETLTVSLVYYLCQEGAEGLCKVGNVVWTVPLVVSAVEGPDAVLLRFNGD